MATYRGFSTAKWLEDGTLSLPDIEVIKQDLQNHIFTRLGERVMQPSFGTRIPDLAFEPNDAETVSIIQEDIAKVINFDPRVEMIALNVMPFTDNNAIIAIVNVLYVEFNVTEELNIDVKTKTVY